MLNLLNLNSLPVFSEVFKLRNMTMAAEKLGMTQSGVSQHIKTLEVALDIVLFVRTKRRIYPTKEAENLYATVRPALVDLNQRLHDITGIEKKIAGRVIIGVPIEFGNNIVFPLLAKMNELAPGISFKIRYGLAYEMNQNLLEGVLDFAFIDEISTHGQLAHEIVYSEELILCCSKKYLKANPSTELNRKYFQKQKYVSYFENHSILKGWFAKGMGLKKFDPANVVLQAEDTQGVYAFIKQSMGLGIIPKHMIRNRAAANIHVFQASYGQVFNDISLVYHSERVKNPTLKFIHEFFIDNLISK